MPKENDVKKRLALVAVAGVAVVAGALTLSLRDPEPRQVVTAAGEVNDVVVTTTFPDLPIEGRLDQNLTCQGEMRMGTVYDSLAGDGFATPEEALDALLVNRYPQAPRTFALTGRDRTRARFENERGAFLVAFLEDGLWHMDKSTICDSEDWTRGGETDPFR